MIDDDLVGLIMNKKWIITMTKYDCLVLKGKWTEYGTTDRDTKESKKRSLSISVHLSLSSGTVSHVSIIDIYDQGCHLQREGVAHGDIW
jgi:hypothetical protein